MMRLFRRSKPAKPAPPAPASSELAALGMFPPEVIGSLRQMTTQLAYQERLPDRIAIASALRGEGVTYLSLALAATLASDLAARICVVELNWWSPGLLAQYAHNLEGEPGGELTIEITCSPGLAGVLADGVPLDHALVPTALPNLLLLPAGELPEARRPAIARSAELKRCIAQIHEQFDYLVLDVPAILTTSDAIALASLGSACCLVVRQGITPAASIRQALDAVKHLPILGVVLNRVSIDTPRWLRAFIPQE